MKKTILFILASLGMLAGIPESFGQAPTLGAASSFGLFTAVGAFDNTGATAVAGDIGTNSGALTGFPPGTLTGAIHVETPTSVDAAKDVDAAYSELASIVTGTVHGTSLGNGEMLTQGVYLLGAASTLTGELVLNGQGNPNALFIIKTEGALSVAALSQVRLLNSASWQNVYWQVDGRVDIGANAAFKGIILANGALNLMANAALQGRGLTRAGAITLDNNSVTTSLVGAPLPVQLTSFTAERRSGNALLRWATASEINNVYFAVQSSADGHEYRTIAKVGGHGSTSSSHAYTWTDVRLDRYSAEAVYYRLAQVDADSSKHYSLVRTITLPAKPVAGIQVQAYPSPSQLPCSLYIDVEQAGLATLCLTDALGHRLTKRQLVLAKGRNSLALDEAKALPAGIYLVQVEQGTMRQTVRLVRE